MKKIKWGLIGGGEGSQIGQIHRISAEIDRRFEFVAGALDLDPDKGRHFGVELGLDPGRAYGDWKEMLQGELSREDPIELVTIATPNVTHFEITQAFLENNFHVLCEKPLTMNPEEAEKIVDLAQKKNRICSVNFGYSGYPLVRHMKAAVRRGDLGKVRLVFAEFAGGFFADAGSADNPRIKWRFDPQQAGVSAITADAGIHALHLACFVTDQKVNALSADFAHCIGGRELEDDSMISFRMSEGTVGRLWSSGMAIGRTHGLALKVYGEKGGFEWRQEQPNQLYWTPLGQSTQILERGGDGLSPEASDNSRITIGHSEGLPLAFANIYRDLADKIEDQKMGLKPRSLGIDSSLAEDGYQSIKTIFAAVKSAKNNSQWVTV